MSATSAVNRKQAVAIPTTNPGKDIVGESIPTEDNSIIRLHITPFTPALLKSYIAPSVLPLAQNISYHTVETFPERGFGYVELPKMEGAKLKKKLNGLTLKGSKVRIEEAKPEKRKVDQETDDAEEKAGKRVKREERKKEQGVLDGAELPSDRKIKRGWTEPPAKNRKEKKDKGKDDEKKFKQKESKYTKEPELLFKAKLTPVAATEVARKGKGKKEKKDKKDRKKPKDEVIVHEFENNTKQPSFLKSTQVAADPKPAVEYINGKGWVDEDGNVVEAETGKARNRRVLELVDPVPVQSPTAQDQLLVMPEADSSKPTSKLAKKERKSRKHVTPPPSSSGSVSEESSVVSSSSGSEDSDSEPEVGSNAKSSASSPAPVEATPEIALTPSSPNQEKKEVHPLEALFKRPKPAAISTPASTLTPVKGLAPINTTFSFFGNEEPMDVDGDAPGNPPVTPFTERDLEWRGLRSAAPTPDTAAIGRRFSFPWRKGSQEVDDDDDDDLEAGKQLTNNTKANASVTHLPGVAEEEEDENAQADTAEHDEEESEDDANATPIGARKGKGSATAAEGEEQDESEFAKWFWENRGENNRAWKKRRRETLKSKRLRDNKKLRRGG